MSTEPFYQSIPTFSGEEEGAGKKKVPNWRLPNRTASKTKAMLVEEDNLVLISMLGERMHVCHCNKYYRPELALRTRVVMV